MRLFREIYGLDLARIEANETATVDSPAPPGVNESFERMAQAIGEFEKSRVFSPFTSKYDFVMTGMTEFTDLERTDALPYGAAIMRIGCR